VEKQKGEQKIDGHVNIAEEEDEDFLRPKLFYFTEIPTFKLQ